MPGAFTAKIGTTLYFDVATNSVSGIPTPADTNPTCWVYRDGNTSPIVGPSGLNPFILGNVYQGKLPLTNSNGFFSQSYYNVIVSGTVNGIPGIAPILTFFAENQSFDNLQPSGSVFSQIVTELSKAPSGAAYSFGEAIQWMYERSRNYSVTNSGLDLVYKSDSVTPLASGVISDDGVNFYRHAYQ